MLLVSMGAVGMIRVLFVSHVCRWDDWVPLGSHGCFWVCVGAVMVTRVLLGLCGCHWGPMGAVVFVCMLLGSVCAIGVPWVLLG